MRSMYQKACSYSWVISKGHPEYRGDVHQAFLYYFNKTGDDLFNQPEGFVLRCVKWMNRKRYCKEHHNKIFTEFDDHFFNCTTPLKELEAKETVEGIYNKIRAYRTGGTSSIDANKLIEFLMFLERGYQTNEICDLMKITKGIAYNYKAKIKSILQPMTNPFAGNPAIVSKKILRKTYEESERYKDFIYDINRNCDVNEYYQLYVHKERNEWILVKEIERNFFENV